jgi:hypothetical protein
MLKIMIFSISAIHSFDSYLNSVSVSLHDFNNQVIAIFSDYILIRKNEKYTRSEVKIFPIFTI